MSGWREAEHSAGVSDMNVMLNWFEELKRHVPAGKRIVRCHSEERGDEGFSLWRQRGE
jgi:hypothetical protein